jgi:hypothetical protein
MKTTKSAPKNETQNGHEATRIMAAEVARCDERRKIENEICKQRRDALEKEVSETIEEVHYYENHMFGHVGFGWRKNDGKLVLFIVPLARNFMDCFDMSEIKEITLKESLEWVEHMDFADRIFDDPMQAGPGYRRWIAALRAVTPASI